MSNVNDFVIKNGVLTKYKCKATEVVIPEGVSEIGDTAFKNAKNIISVVVPEGVTKIGSKAFNGCCNLESIQFPSTLTEGFDWYYNIFGGCTSLKEVVVSENNPKFASHGGVLYQKFNGIKTWLHFVPEAIEHVEIPEEVSYISGGAFANCRNLKELALPQGLLSIGDGCFAGCSFKDPLVIPENVGADLPSCRDIGVPILINYDHVDAKGRVQALIGFSIAYCRSMPLNEKMKKDYITYARKQRKKLYPLAMQNEFLRQMLFAEKIISVEDAYNLLDDITNAQNGELAAEILEYLNN